MHKFSQVVEQKLFILMSANTQFRVESRKKYRLYKFMMEVTYLHLRLVR